MKVAARSETLHRSPLVALAGAVLGLIVGLAGSAVADDGVLLRWKLEPGQIVRYSVVQTTTFESKAEGGRGVQSERRQEVDLHWSVSKVEGEVADLTLVIDRIRVRYDSDRRAIAFVLDTAAEAPAVDGPFPAKLVELLRGMVGAEIVFRLSVRGEVSDVKPSASLETLIRQAGSLGGARLFSDVGLRNLVGHTVPYFPEGRVSPGTTWTRQVSAPMPMFGAQITDKLYTDRGPRDDAPDVHDVSVVSQITLQPSPEAPLEMNLRKQSAVGAFAFDVRRGLAVSGRLEESLTTFVSAGGPSVVQTAKTLLEVRLLPSDDPSR